MTGTPGRNSALHVAREFPAASWSLRMISFCRSESPSPSILKSVSPPHTVTTVWIEDDSRHQIRSALKACRVPGGIAEFKLVEWLLYFKLFAAWMELNV